MSEIGAVGQRAEQKMPVDEGKSRGEPTAEAQRPRARVGGDY